MLQLLEIKLDNQMNGSLGHIFNTCVCHPSFLHAPYICIFQTTMNQNLPHLGNHPSVMKYKNVLNLWMKDNQAFYF